MSGEFPKIGIPYFGVLITRILLFRVLYWGPLFSETPSWVLKGLEGFGELRITVQGLDFGGGA